MFADRRRSPRVPCDLPILWKRGWRSVTVRMIDLNVDGAFVRTDLAIPRDELLDLEVTLPDGPLGFLGVARFIGVSRHGAGAGVAIHAMSKGERARWNGYYQEALRGMLDAMPPAIAAHLRRG